MIDVIFSSKASDLNKKLVKFFDLNLTSMLDAKIKFKFEVAHPKDADKYAQRGILGYPVAMHGKTRVTGTNKIIAYLKHLIDKHNKRIKNKSDGDIVDDYWKNTLGKHKVDTTTGAVTYLDDEEEEDNADNVQHRLQEAFEQRSKATEMPSNPNRGARGSTANLSGPRDTTSKIMDEIRSDNVESPADTLRKMKSRGGMNNDDKLMAQFYENSGIGID